MNSLSVPKLTLHFLQTAAHEGFLDVVLARDGARLTAVEQDKMEHLELLAEELVSSL